MALLLWRFAFDERWTPVRPPESDWITGEHGPLDAIAVGAPFAPVDGIAVTPAIEAEPAFALVAASSPLISVAEGSPSPLILAGSPLEPVTDSP